MGVAVAALLTHWADWAVGTAVSHSRSSEPNGDVRRRRPVSFDRIPPHILTGAGE